MDIKIINDPEQMYKPNQVMPATQLLEEYIWAINVDENGKEQTKWLKSVPVKSAINHIAEMWGLDVEFID